MKSVFKSELLEMLYSPNIFTVLNVSEEATLHSERNPDSPPLISAEEVMDYLRIASNLGLSPNSGYSRVDLNENKSVNADPIAPLLKLLTLEADDFQFSENDYKIFEGWAHREEPGTACSLLYLLKRRQVATEILEEWIAGTCPGFQEHKDFFMGLSRLSGTMPYKLNERIAQFLFLSLDPDPVSSNLLDPDWSAGTIAAFLQGLKKTDDKEIVELILKYLLKHGYLMDPLKRSECWKNLLNIDIFDFTEKEPEVVRMLDESFTDATPYKHVLSAAAEGSKQLSDRLYEKVAGNVKSEELQTLFAAGIFPSLELFNSITTKNPSICEESAAYSLKKGDGLNNIFSNAPYTAEELETYTEQFIALGFAQSAESDPAFLEAVRLIAEKNDLTGLPLNYVCKVISSLILALSNTEDSNE